MNAEAQPSLDGRQASCGLASAKDAKKNGGGRALTVERTGALV